MVFVLGAILSAWAGPAVAQTAAGWTQFQGGEGHPGAATDAPAPPFRLAWSAPFELGGPEKQNGLSPPVATSDTAVAVGPTDVVSVGLAGGEKGWETTRDLGPSVPPAIATVKGKPVVVFTEGARVAAATATSTSASVTPVCAPSDAGEDVSSHVVAIPLGGDTRSWTVDLKDVSCTGVTVAGGTAYVGDSSGEIVAVDVATGEETWRKELDGIVARPLAAGGGLLVVAVQGDTSTLAHIIALGLDDGEQRWSFAPKLNATVATAPAIVGDLVVAPFNDDEVHALDLADGSELWSTRLTAPVSPLGIAAGSDEAIVVVDYQGEVYRLAPDTGNRVWDFALNEVVLRGTPVVGPDDVMLTTDRGRVVAIDLASGDLVWKSGTGPLLRSLAVAGDRMLAVRGGGRPGLVAYSTDPAGVLVREVSPTVVDPARLFGWLAAAAIPLGFAVVFLSRPLLRRLGPLGAGVSDGETGDEAGAADADEEPEP